MDTLGWYIATLHQMIGHDRTAAVLGQSVGDKQLCVLCKYEAGRATRQEVIDRIGRR